MEEENKNVNVEEPTEVLGNTGVIEPVTEEPVLAEPVAETPVEVPTESPVMEAPAEEPVEVQPEAVMAQVDTKAEDVPAETVTPMPEPVPTEPVQEQAVEGVVAEPAVEQPKKKSKLPLILLLLIVLAAGGFAVWYFVLGGNGSKSEKQEDKPTEEKIGKDETEKDDGKKEESEDKEDKVTVFPLEESEIKKYEEIMKQMVRLRREKSELNVSDISNQVLLRISISDLIKEGPVSKDALKAVIEKNYGNIEYTDEDIICTLENIPFIIYNSENGEYSYNPNHRAHGGDGIGAFYTNYYFQSAEQDETNGTLTIKYKILFGLYYEDVASKVPIYYKNSTDSFNKTNEIFKDMTIEPAKYDETANQVYEQHKDELPITTFTFEKDKTTGNYVFRKVVTE